MVTAIKALPYEERLCQLNLPSIAFRHMRGDMINVFKYANEMFSCKLLDFNCTSDTRSNGFKLTKTRCKTVKYKNFFTNSVINVVIDVWNRLPSEVVSAASVNSVKNRLDRQWCAHQMKYNPNATHHPQPQFRLLDNLTSHAHLTKL